MRHPDIANSRRGNRRFRSRCRPWTGGSSGRLLLDGDCRRQPSIRSTSGFSSARGTGGISRQRLDVAPLPFRVDVCRRRERTYRSRRARDDASWSRGSPHRILEVVTRAADGDPALVIVMVRNPGGLKRSLYQLPTPNFQTKGHEDTKGIEVHEKTKLLFLASISRVSWYGRTVTVTF